MSVENGDRFMRLLAADVTLREKVRASGEDGFLELSASAGASCTPFEVVSAMLRDIDNKS